MGGESSGVYNIHCSTYIPVSVWCQVWAPCLVAGCEECSVCWGKPGTNPVKLSSGGWGASDFSSRARTPAQIGHPHSVAVLTPHHYPSGFWLMSNSSRFWDLFRNLIKDGTFGRFFPRSPPSRWYWHDFSCRDCVLYNYSMMFSVPSQLWKSLYSKGLVESWLAKNFNSGEMYSQSCCKLCWCVSPVAVVRKLFAE